MRIVQFMASRKYGGAEKVFVELANELSMSHEVKAIVLKKTEYLNRFSERVEVVPLESNPTKRNPFLLFEIRRILRNINPDIVHTHADKATELVRLALIGTFIEQMGTKHNARKGKIFGKITWVAAVSKNVEASIRKRSKAKTWVINNGILPRQSWKSSRSRQAHHISDGMFSILAIGRLDRIKGFDILLEQLGAVPFPFHLTIAGEGDEKQSLQNLVSCYGLEQSVSFPGHCENIPELMEKTDLIVIPSHSEGFSFVFVEALFYANMVIATPVGIIPEVVPEHFLFHHQSLSAKVEEVFSEYSRFHEEFRRIQDQHAHRFTLSDVSARYQQAYQYILQSKQ